MPRPPVQALSRALTLALPLAIALALALATPFSAAETPHQDELRRRLREAWSADVEAWGDYAFRRHVLRQSYDSKGEVTFRRELVFQVTPGADRFDEELIEIDGRAPSAKEVSYHRGKQRFTNHYEQAAELELDNPMGEDLALLPLIREQEHQLVGQEVVDGIPCYRTRFEAGEEVKRGSLNERLKHAIQGTACFDVKGFHVVSFEMETVRPVKNTGVKLSRLEMKIRGHAVGGAWLPASVEMVSHVSLFGKKLRKSNDYRYGDFVHAPAN